MKKSILIVEDYPEAGATFKELLELLGHEVEWVVNGQSAMQKLNDGAFDLVFMDLNLPDMHGLVLLKQVQDKRLGPNTRFIAVSGHSAKDAAAVEATKVFDHYLEKPIDLAVLNRILSSTA
ncbi:response regulator [Methylovorus glucosotrophus]|uniref:Response regulator receiver protein n=1 Tax=Methylovorus glucosotrophus (strain SIP3-4) TaxID=582744 RepID=C6XE58_METGS|nr:response regulator [Methylovorus glucosotrophus]ACT50833.1 response regulator receiver protein [Methylovorus glucosotrophus SIP3-4]KAF0843780.1 response regulator receiver domain-containing protein [Methylovorus glucosotrophus]